MTPSQKILKQTWFERPGYNQKLLLAISKTRRAGKQPPFFFKKISPGWYCIGRRFYVFTY